MSLKSVALAVIYTGFTVVGVGLAVTARTGQDRLLGAWVAAFFGLGGALYFGRDLPARGLRAQPSPALRVGGGRTGPDRLAFSASPLRVVYLAGTGTFFALCAAVGVGMMGGVVGGFEAVLGSAGAIAAAVVIVQLVRGPLLVFERDTLRWRAPFRGWRGVAYTDLVGGEIVASVAGDVCALHLRDPDAYLASLSPRHLRDAAKHLAWTGAPIVLPNGVAPNAEQILALVAQYASFPERAVLGASPSHRGTDDLALPTKPEG